MGWRERLTRAVADADEQNEIIAAPDGMPHIEKTKSIALEVGMIPYEEMARLIGRVNAEDIGAIPRGHLLILGFATTREVRPRKTRRTMRLTYRPKPWNDPPASETYHEVEFAAILDGAR